MFNQTPRDYLPNSELSTRSWSRPLMETIVGTDVATLDREVNELMENPKIHICALSPTSRDNGHFMCSVVYQVRTER